MTGPSDGEDAGFAALLQAARSGDESAMERLLTVTSDRLQRVVDQRLGVRLRASLRQSDVLQNSYLAMLQALPRFTGSTQDDFVSWFARIIENDIKRQHRWFGARKRRPPSRTSQRNLLAGILLPETPTPSAEVASSEERARMQAALARLDPEYVRVIELVEFEDMSHREAGARLGRSEGACRMLLHRARAALAMELEKLSGGG